jgi:hypothetical protein
MKFAVKVSVGLLQPEEVVGPGATINVRRSQADRHAVQHSSPQQNRTPASALARY